MYRLYFIIFLSWFLTLLLNCSSSGDNKDNSQVSNRINPGGGQYGAFSCRSGYVWREASPSDLVCVTPETRTQTAYDNSMAVDRVAPIPKAFGRVSAPPPICITAESARKRNSPAAPALEAQCRDATK